MTETTTLEVRLDGTDDPSLAAPTPCVRPLNAGDLRLMAAWAAQEPGPELAFAYDGSPSLPDGRIEVLSDLASASPEQVVIRVRTVGRPVTAASVTAEVDGMTGRIGADVYGAALWSEAAVQKFLAPYLASLAGGGAAAVLAALDRIWNGYPADRPVFALLHRSRRRPGRELDVKELVDVWHVDLTGAQPVLRVTPAADFLPLCHEPPAAPAPSAVAYRPGILHDEPHLPSAYELRRIGEWTAALRRQPMYFLLDAATGLLQSPVRSLPERPRDCQVVPVFTPETRLGRVEPGTVTLHPLDGEPKELTQLQADAAFWDSGTVVKLLLPYYAMAYGASRLRSILELYGRWTGKEVDAPGAEGSVLEEATDVYAVIHLPKSDWESEAAPDPAPPPVDAVAAVYAGPRPAGGVRPTRVALLREAPEP